MRFQFSICAFPFQDLETFDLEDFKYNSVNITAFRIVDVENAKVRESLDVMEKFQPIGNAILNRSGVIQVKLCLFVRFRARVAYNFFPFFLTSLKAEPALMFDSVYVFAKGLAAMDSGHSIKPVNLSCDLERPWDDGLSLYNYIDAVVS